MYFVRFNFGEQMKSVLHTQKNKNEKKKMILENSDCTNLSDENYRVNMLVNVKGKRMRASVSYFYM